MAFPTETDLCHCYLEAHLAIRAGAKAEWEKHLLRSERLHKERDEHVARLSAICRLHAEALYGR